MMKKPLALILAAASVVALVGCARPVWRRGRCQVRRAL